MHACTNVLIDMIFYSLVLKIVGFPICMSRKFGANAHKTCVKQKIY